MRQGLNKETTSEYQRSYDEGKFHTFPENYQTNLDFRVQQKGRFQRHVRAPFEWDEDEWYETESDVSCDETFQSRRRMQPLSKYKHDKLNRMYHERLEHGYDPYATRPRTASPFNRSVSPGNRRRDNRSDGEEVHVIGGGGGSGGGRRDIYIHYDDDDEEDGVDRSRSTGDMQRQHRRSASRSGGARSRPMTDPGPFVPYGKANNSTEVAQKKTHNVRASDQVHQSALRAQHRLHSQQIENSDTRHRIQDSAKADASRNSMSRSTSYTPEGVRGSPYGTNADGSKGRKGNANKDGAYRHGVTMDADGNVVPWQRGGSRSPYIPDGTGTKRWVSEYEREYRVPPPPRGTMSIPGAGVPQDTDWARRTVGASYPPNDPVGFGLSYGRRLRDQDIIPAI